MLRILGGRRPHGQNPQQELSFQPNSNLGAYNISGLFQILNAGIDINCMRHLSIIYQKLRGQILRIEYETT